jgi:hypothetical protein
VSTRKYGLQSMNKCCKRSLRLACSAVIALTSAYCIPVLAGTVDSADFCVTATDMQFGLNLSALNPDAFDIILRISPDADTFTIADKERISVNFDLDTGAITRQEPIVETFGTPEFDRWVDGLIDDFNIVPLGGGNAQITGSVSLGADKLLPGGEIKSVGVRDGATNVFGPHPITACSPAPIVISVTETVAVSDDQNLLLGIKLSINEIISVSDEILVIPPLSIVISESIGVSDDIVIEVGPTLADTIDLTLPPGSLLPGTTITADAGGFKPLTEVEAFLQSDPIKVGGEMADADGNVSFQITIPADFPPGDHTLILLGQAPDGSERRLTAAIRIDPPDTIFKDGFE